MKLSRSTLIFALLVIGLLVILLLSRLFFSENNFDPERLAVSFEEARGTTKILFYIVAVAFTAIGLPRQLVAFVGGYVFGVMAGLALSLMIAIAGCALAFTVARTVLRGFVQGRYPKAVSSLNALIRDDAFLKIIVLRLQPLGTNLLSNLCAGVSNIHAPLYLSASLVGYIPQMLVFALMGSGLRVDSQQQLFVSVVLLLVSLGLGWWLYLRHKQRSSGSGST